MNRKDLIAEVAKVACSKKEAEMAVNSFIGAITKALKKGDKVTLTGFGTFSVVKRAARKGRNPYTGEAIRIKALKIPKFKPGRGLKAAVK